MPNFDIIKENKADKDSFRVQSIIGMFDLQNEHIKEHFKDIIEYKTMYYYKNKFEKNKP